MLRACVFCGQTSVKLSKEHVIPRWLIRFLGDERAPLKIWTPLYARGGQVTTFAQGALQFPACLKCNNEFSSLESAAKAVVERLMNEDLLSVQDFSVLLDWVDKIRVGIWLGMRVLERDPFQMSVNFHISQRIGRKDRALLVYHVSDPQMGWACLGISTPAFHKHPSCFTLVLGRYYLLNISTDFLLSRALGAPYPLRAKIGAGGTVEFVFVRGLGQITAPLLPFLTAPGCGVVLQPVFRDLLDMELMPEDVAYIRGLGLTGPNGAGPIVLVNPDGTPEIVKAPTRMWQPTASYRKDDHLRVFLRQTLTIQNVLMDRYETDDANATDDILHCRNFNEACIHEIDERKETGLQ